MSEGPVITDHAVLRFLERSQGVDIARIRRDLRRRAAVGIRHGASAVIAGSIKLIIRDNTVVTVIHRDWGLSHDQPTIEAAPIRKSPARKRASRKKAIK